MIEEAENLQQLAFATQGALAGVVLAIAHEMPPAVQMRFAGHLKGMGEMQKANANTLASAFLVELADQVAGMSGGPPPRSPDKGH